MNREARDILLGLVLGLLMLGGGLYLWGSLEIGWIQTAQLPGPPLFFVPK
jgi:hypothetical protein